MTHADLAADYHYLVRFGKSGAARYLSHHDVRRTWERLTRRARLPLAYSRGYRPKPRLTFGPPLQVGAEGARECVIVSLRESLPVDDVAVRLRAAATDGMPVGDVSSAARRRLRPVWAAYRLQVDSGAAGVPDSIDRLLALDRVDVERPARDGRPASIRDIRPGVLDLQWTNGAGLMARLSLAEPTIVTPRDLGLALGITFAHILRTEIELADE